MVHYGVLAVGSPHPSASQPPLFKEDFTESNCPPDSLTPGEEHGCRMVMGADHRKLLPVSVLSGGLMTVWADILGRILIHGVDIPLGVSLSLIGAPVFLGMLIRRSYHFGGEGA